MLASLVTISIHLSIPVQFVKILFFLTLPIFDPHVQCITMTRILLLPFQDMVMLHVSVQTWTQLSILLTLDLGLNLVLIFVNLSQMGTNYYHYILHSLCSI